MHSDAQITFGQGKPRNPRGKIRDAEDLGQAIRKRRKKLGLTQVQLADAASAPLASSVSWSAEWRAVTSSKCSTCASP